jgi:hypothetical protein
VQNNKEHIWNVQSLPVVMSVSKASLTGALSLWHSASAGTDKSAFILHLNLPHFIKQPFSGYLQFLSRLRSYRKNVPKHDEDLVLKYWHSFLHCLLVLAKDVNCLSTLSGSVSSQQIKAQIRIWGSRRSIQLMKPFSN